MGGYVYFATNSVMPGLTKIGFTESVLAERFSALQSTGVPVPFELFAAFSVDDPQACEKAIHGALTDVRLAENREFFRIVAREAVQTVLPLLFAHLSVGPGTAHESSALFGDLDLIERDALAAFAMAPSPQRPNDWELLKRILGLDELDARHHLLALRQKGYLREVRAGGAILYDLAPKGVSFGRAVRDDPDYVERFDYWRQV